MGPPRTRTPTPAHPHRRPGRPAAASKVWSTIGLRVGAIYVAETNAVQYSGDRRTRILVFWCNDNKKN